VQEHSYPRHDKVTMDMSKTRPWHVSNPSKALPPQRLGHGFTLVELLVVIGIIAILIAMLMPALQRARSAAVMVQCMSNQRQVAMGILQYSIDNHNTLPPAGASSPGWVGSYMWYSGKYVGKYIGNQYGFRDDGAGSDATRNSSKISICPLFGKGLPGYDGLGIGINECWDNGFGWGTNKYTSIRDASRTLLLIDVAADSSGYRAYFFEQFYQGDASPRSWSGSGRVVAYRHGKRTVASFADGHVDSFASNFNDWESTQYNQGLHRALLSGLLKYKAK
jgi:prepilin-type N-terminal cleavage/methylation domain-containing protein/prepilin-type processing-associated H-X9-DG protein